MNRKVAIPIWESRVSPVMDTARYLLIVDIIDGAEASRITISLPQRGTTERARFISDQGVDTLICGALSRDLLQVLVAGGIETRPWFRGPVEEVLAAHLRGDLRQEHLMPGCGRHSGLGRGRNCRRRTGSHQVTRQKEKS